MSDNTAHAAAPPDTQQRYERFAPLLLVAAAINWCFQAMWFWRFCGRNINADAVCYIGIARQIAEGDFKASVHGYWSPLISWLLAPLFLVTNDRTLTARLLMLLLFATCLVLAYRLTYRLWGARLPGAAVVLWLTAARGVSAFSLCFIGADFLLTACVLIYFIVLLGCLEKPEKLGQWVVLGLAHGVAFLAKAISLPLLAVSTLLAVLSAWRGNTRRSALALACAAIFPVLSMAGWGTAIRAKYQVFSSGYQLRFNLLDPAARRAAAHGGLAVLHDARATYDSYMVTDQMPPGSPLWRLPVWRPGLLRQILQREAENIPEALKQLLVLLTPGGVLALLLAVIQLTRGRLRAPTRFRFIWIVLLTTAALILAYCMLVFDGRYILPICVVLMAVSVRFALPTEITRTELRDEESVADAGRWQALAALLLIAGLIGVQLYWASPFRTIHQDFQRSVYEAANQMRNGTVRTVVLIGNGPYPEHGVGWEAGVYSAYFAGARVVGDLFEEPDEAPRSIDVDSLVGDIATLSPDAVMIWDARTRPRYSRIASELQQTYQGASTVSIGDPVKGKVGTLILLKR